MPRTSGVQGNSQTSAALSNPHKFSNPKSSLDVPVLCCSEGARGERPETASKRQLGALTSSPKTVPAGALKQNVASTTNNCITDLGQEGEEQVENKFSNTLPRVSAITFLFVN